jgi:hypothetical protein
VTRRSGTSEVAGVGRELDKRPSEVRSRFDPADTLRHAGDRAGRHNIAEIALHHAWCVRAVTGRISGEDPAPFPLDGDDWFARSDTGPLDWTRITAEVEQRQAALTLVVESMRDGRAQSPLTESERFDVLLGVTCHAVYHAGQVQLIKVVAQAGQAR